MMHKISNSWKLAKFSFSILKSDLSLMVLPTISGIIVMLLTISFFLPIFALGGEDANGDFQMNPISIVLIFLYYLISYIVIIYFNVALTAILFKKFEGIKMTFSEGFAESNKRMGNIIKYSLIAATVGMILNAINSAARNSDNKGVALFGQLFAGILDVAWSLITFLVIPVMVMQNMGPIDTIKESGRLLKSTWGEQFFGTFSFGIILFFLSLPSLAISFLLIAIGTSSSSLFVVLGVLLLIATVIILMLAQTTVTAIFRAVLYKYVTEGKAVGGFSQESLQGAFQAK